MAAPARETGSRQAGPAPTTSGEAPLIALQDISRSFARQGGPDSSGGDGSGGNASGGNASGGNASGKVTSKTKRTKDAAAVKDGVTVLHGITLDIQAGEFTALQGTSGSGKSTLLHILGLLDRATSGRYVLQGKDVSRLGDDALSALRSKHIGFVFQSFYLIPYATALDNVLMPGLYTSSSQRELTRRAKELLGMVGLGDRLHHKPSQLSGGQQQRVALARALINSPSLLLADEPTGQLDSRTSQEILQLFGDVNARGATVIIVTHDADVAAYAKRRLHMEDGRIVLDESNAKG